MLQKLKSAPWPSLQHQFRLDASLHMPMRYSLKAQPEREVENFEHVLCKHEVHPTQSAQMPAPDESRRQKKQGSLATHVNETTTEKKKVPILTGGLPSR